MTDTAPLHTEMDCDVAEAMLPLVADGVLLPEDDPALFAHLAACPDCAASLAAHDLVQVALEGGLPSAPQPRVNYVAFPWYWLASAAALLALTIGGWAWHQHHSGSTEAPSTNPLAAGQRTHLLRIEHGTADDPEAVRYIFLQETDTGYRTIAVEADGLDGGAGSVEHGEIVPVGFSR